MCNTDGMGIYLDNNATTAPLRAVVDAVLAALQENSANPSSLHGPGRLARTSVEHAREQVAALVRCGQPEEIIFTSGGTESICQALYAGTQAPSGHQPRLIISTVEHSAVFDAAMRRKTDNVLMLETGVDGRGTLDLDALEGNLRASPSCSLVSVTLANNETGVVFPALKIRDLCHKYGMRLHLDAVQAAGKMPIDVNELGCDYLSLAAHKFHGPKGAGALYVRTGTPRHALLPGRQECGARGGTENVLGIMGMGVAAHAARVHLDHNQKEMAALRDRLERGILAAIPAARINGDTRNRLCNTTNVHFPGRSAAALVEQLSERGVYVSAGAACSTAGEPSHVLRAMGLGREVANASLRLSVSPATTIEEVEAATRAIVETVSSSPAVYRMD
jgi:cysteine desulfurase